MYTKSSNGGFVGCVKVDGKILREDTDGVVKLPFGSEFALLLKNLSSLRAMATVSIDGVNATEGANLIIPANGELELERFIKDGNMSSGNKFKFIERTAGIEAHKGIGSSDGLVRIEYRSEVQPVQHKTTVIEHVEHVYRRPYWRPYGPYWYDYPNNGLIGNASLSTTLGGLQQQMQNTQFSAQGTNQGTAQSNSGEIFAAMNMAETSSTGTASPPRPSVPSSGILRTAGLNSRAPQRKMMNPQASAGPKMKMVQAKVTQDTINDVGITVPGAESHQRFTVGTWFPTETVSHVIVLQLRGVIGGKPIIQAITVKTKAKCSTCGKTNKSTEKFCGQCGTALFLL